MTKRQSVDEPMEDVSSNNTTTQDLKKLKQGHEASVEDSYENDLYEIKSDFLKKSIFEIYYMEVQARAEVVRLMLEYVGATYRNRAPVEWPKGKSETMFGYLPQLIHTKPDGSKFELSETKSIARYIAILFGLWGSTIEEEATLDMLMESISENIFQHLLEEIWTKPDASELASFERFMEKAKLVFDGIERFLVKNGSNGYFLNTKTTLPDFALFSWLGHFFLSYNESAKKHFSPTSSYASIFKVYQRLNNHPRIRHYIDGGRWKVKSSSTFLSMNSTIFFVNDADKMHKFYTETLGLKCAVDAEPAPGHRYLEFEFPFSQTRLSLVNVGEDCPAVMKKTTPADSVILNVQDVFDVHAMLTKKGVEFHLEPSDQGWGCIAEFKDPEGNLISITSPSKLGGSSA
ncbi:hypothetical protein BGW42_003627 [Actinomortierella wolfii]|nr:hypothetical protein BGW42_003627 [Actinomortierella wolfii]